MNDDTTLATSRRIPMATIPFGNLIEFDPKTDSITAYVERITLYFQANEVANGKKVATFLSAIGAKTYALLRNLTTYSSRTGR